MAAITPRVAPTSYNLAIASATVITASSEQTALPIAFVRDAQPSKRWRSVLGWNIVAGFNDKLDFNRTGAQVATLTAGNYATGALMAAQIVTALEAADAVPVWACSYDAGTKKFTISSDLAFVLVFGTGANISTGCGKDLGYSVADTGSAVSHVADLAAYHSREYVAFDFGAANGITLGIVNGHNSGTSGTYTLYGKASASPWTTPATTQVLAGDDTSNKRILAFASQSYRYWAIVIDNVQNTDGYSELGVPYIGTYWEPARAYQAGVAFVAEALSDIERAIEGAMYVAIRGNPRRYRFILRWMSRADRNTYRSIENEHGHVFFFFDPLNYSGLETVYGVLSPAAISHEGEIPGADYHSISGTLSENLG